MEHPLIGNLDTLTIEDLSKKITDLNNKLSIAARTGNGHLCNQIRMAVESYQNKYQEKVQETYRKQIEDSNFNSKIDIK
tara:strand:- start:249 stop:485 length:237 start_codon:yes stop_codon:yes gene_type:complete